MGRPGTRQKTKFKKIFYEPKEFYCQKIFKFKKKKKTQNFPNTSKTNPSNKSKFPRLPKIPLSYVLNNNFSYTEIYLSLVI